MASSDGVLDAMTFGKLTRLAQSAGMEQQVLDGLDSKAELVSWLKAHSRDSGAEAELAAPAPAPSPAGLPGFGGWGRVNILPGTFETN